MSTSVGPTGIVTTWPEGECLTCGHHLPFGAFETPEYYDTTLEEYVDLPTIGVCISCKDAAEAANHNRECDPEEGDTCIRHDMALWHPNQVVPS